MYYFVTELKGSANWRVNAMAGAFANEREKYDSVFSGAEWLPELRLLCICLDSIIIVFLPVSVAGVGCCEGDECVECYHGGGCRFEVVAYCHVDGTD